MYLLLHKIKFHLCCTFIHSINQAFKKSPGAQSHPFFDLPSDDVTLDGSQVLSKDKSRRSAWPRQPLAVHSQPARWRRGSCHCPDRGCRGQSSPSPALPAGPLGAGVHGPVAEPSPGCRAARASLWAGLDQGLRGSLCPWYKSE